MTHNATGLHTALVNDFHLETYHAEQLERYYVLHWRTDYLLDQLYGGDSLILKHDGVEYVPVFKSHIQWNKPAAQVKLSFRKSGDAKIPNYVLIKTFGAS